MHIEIEVGLNFIISYLYNKLPRRRVNIFGEELEKALKHKFQGHWYPDKPVKGSAFRCFKTGDITDQVLEVAALQSGVPVADILENLPNDLSVWMDPGEVSYRIGEKGVIKILYSEAAQAVANAIAASHAAQQQQQQQQQPPLLEEFCVQNLDHEVNRTFNPDAQCFKPIEMMSAKFNGLSLNGGGADKSHSQSSNSDNSDNSDESSGDDRQQQKSNGSNNVDDGFVDGVNSNASFLPRSHAPLTFTTATFAQTKFGSTKLKTNSKRSSRQFNSRLSPVEFNNFLKQRSMQQYLHTPNSTTMLGAANLSPSRSLSPSNHSMINNDPFYYHHNSSNNSNNSSGQQTSSNQTSNGYYQQFLGSHHHLYGNNGGNSVTSPSPLVTPTNASSISISSTSSSNSSASSSSANIGDHLLHFNGFNGSPSASNQNTNLSHRLTGQLFNHFYSSPNDVSFGGENAFFGPGSAQLTSGDPTVSSTTGEGKPKFGAIGTGMMLDGNQSMDSNFPSLINDNNGNNSNGIQKGLGGDQATSPSASTSPFYSNSTTNASNSAAFPQLLVAN